MRTKLAIVAVVVLLAVLASTGAHAGTAGFFISGGHVKLQKNTCLTVKAVVIAPCVDSTGSPVIISIIEPDCEPERIPYGAQIVIRLQGKIENNYVRFYYPGNRKGNAGKVKGEELPQLNAQDSLSPCFERLYPSGALVRDGVLPEGMNGSSYVLGLNTVSYWSRGVKAIESKTYAGPIQLWGRSKDNYEPLSFEFVAERLPEGMSLTDSSPSNIQAIKAWMYAGSSSSGHAAGSMGLDPAKVDAQLGQLWNKLNDTIDVVDGIQDWIKKGESAPEVRVGSGLGQSGYIPESSGGRGSYSFCVKTKSGRLYEGIMWLKLCDKQGEHTYAYYLTPEFQNPSARDAIKRRCPQVQWFDDQGHIGFDNVLLGVRCTYQYSFNGQVWAQPKDYNTSDGQVDIKLGGN